MAAAILGCMANYQARAQTVFKNSELQATLIFPHTWVIETADNNAMYLLEGSKKSLLIDTGTPCKDLDKIVGAITRKPLQVVLTHAHPDHTGNIGSFAEIYMHPADTFLLDTSYSGRIHYVDEGYVFRLGGRNISVFRMPAHTPGSVVLTDTRISACFTGDAFGSGQVWLQLKPVAPMAVYAASCKKMEHLMDKTGISKIYCGHYPYAKKAFDKNYIVDMRRMAESIDNGTAIDAQPYPIKASIGPDNPMILTSGSAGIVYDPDHIK